MPDIPDLTIREIQSRSLIRIVDDDEGVRKSFRYLLEGEGWLVRTYDSAESFLEGDFPLQPGCILLDVRMTGMSGIELQALLNARQIRPRIIFISAHGTIPIAVQAVKNGAIDFLTKPVDEDELLNRIAAAAKADIEERQATSVSRERLAAWRRLTVREIQVAREIARGVPNKVAAANLGISERTVQVHRANAMRKLGIRSAAELAVMLIDIGVPASK